MKCKKALFLGSATGKERTAIDEYRVMRHSGWCSPCAAFDGCTDIRVFLGNQNFASYAAIIATSSNNTTLSNISTITGCPIAISFTSNAGVISANIFIAGIGIFAAMLF